MVVLSLTRLSKKSIYQKGDLIKSMGYNSQRSKK